MAHDVFISYVAHDKATADAICASIEARRLRCWIAPRDILPGADWAASIVDAITGSRAMVLVFSAETNLSSQVKREVEKAVNCGVAIIPFRVEDVPFSKSLSYFLSTCHWLDALTPPIETHISRLTAAVDGLLKGLLDQTLADPVGATSSPIGPQLPVAEQRRPISAVDVGTFQRRAAEGDQEAQFQLGACYAIGAHVPKDPSEAAAWYRKAAESGHPEAQFRLGLSCYTGKGVGPNNENAAAWYRMAALQGHAEAQFWLGLCYESPIGVAKDPLEAASWFRKAAEQGHASAQDKLGFCYQYGRGVNQNLAEAVHWYELAALQGHQDAQYGLGWCYEHGEGVVEDSDRAIKWYRLAAAQGSPDAKAALEQLGAV